MKKYLVTIASVLVIGVITRGVLIKVVRKVIIDEFAKREEEGVKEEVKDNRFRDVIFETRSNAEQMIKDMNELIGHHGVVTASDFDRLIGIDISNRDSIYGWTDLSMVHVIMTIHGCYITLSNPVLIK